MKASQSSRLLLLSFPLAILPVSPSDAMLHHKEPPLLPSELRANTNAPDPKVVEREQPPEATHTDLLRGPAIGASKPPTLVEWQYDGSLRELETLPEEAALALLALDEATHAETDAILARREAHFDRVLSRNIILALHIDAAGKAEDKLLLARLLLELLAHFEPLRHEPHLRQQIADVLPQDQRRQYLDALRMYDAAWMQDAHAKRPKDTASDPVGLILERTGATFTHEIERSFKRIESSGLLAFEYVLAQLELEPEQTERIRTSSARYLSASPEGMTERDYGLVFFSVAAHLNEAQREKLAEILHGL